jgi:hypothetical protein
MELAKSNGRSVEDENFGERTFFFIESNVPQDSQE